MIYEMFQDIPIYECDPDKNKDCEKTFCVFNIDAKGRECHCCISSDYEWDGKKARKVKHRNNLITKLTLSTRVNP